MAANLKLKDAKGDQFVFVLKAANGEPILSSETYNQRRRALNGIESVTQELTIEFRFKREAAKNGQQFFVLKAANGETIGKKARPTRPNPQWKMASPRSRRMPPTPNSKT